MSNKQHEYSVIYKPMFAGLIAFGVEQGMLNKTAGVKNNALFAGSVAAGCLIADLVVRNNKQTVTGALEQRVLEVGLATGVSMGVDKFILHKPVQFSFDANNTDMRHR